MPRLLEMVRADRTVLTLLRVHALRVRARRLFPDSWSLQTKWVDARLRMRRYGCRRPRVLIGARTSMEMVNEQ